MKAIRISTTGGRLYTEPLRLLGGLAITDGYGVDDGLYVITHVRSGRKLAAFSTLTHASRAMRRLAAAGDWTQTFRALKASAAMRAHFEGVIRNATGKAAAR